MKKEDLWSAYVSRNPHWATENVTLTPSGLRKLFDQTYDKGHSQGVANGKAIASRGTRDASARNAANPLRDIFGL